MIKCLTCNHEQVFVVEFTDSVGKRWIDGKNFSGSIELEQDGFEW